MNSLESVGTLLREHLGEAATFEHEIQNYLLIIANVNYSQRVYDCFFNWIANSNHSPENIIQLLDIYVRDLDGFSTNKSIQTLVSYPCIEALAGRRPAVLEGPWEKIAWIIIKYAPCSNTMLEKEITKFKEVDEATLKWIEEISSPELCPNPFLRLELFRLMSSFNRNEFDYDCVSFRDKIISTIIEVFENYSLLTVDQLPNFSPRDLQHIMTDHKISMGSIMNELVLYQMRFDIIIAVLWFTRNLALLEKARKLKLELNNQVITMGIWNFGLDIQLSYCLTFCGLIATHLRNPPDNEGFDYNACLLYFEQVISNDPFLLNIVIHTLGTINEVSLSFPDEHDLHDFITKEKDKLFHRFVKDHISQLPTYQYLQEIHGCFTPGAEYHLRYIQNNTMNQYTDSETDSEYYDNGNDY